MNFIDPDIRRAKTLPSETYFKEDFFKLEKENIFQRSWQYISEINRIPPKDFQAPGSYFTFEVAGRPLVAVCGKDGMWRAFHNVCRHRASTIAQGAGQCTVLRCPYHHWTYSLEGKLLSQPDFEGVQDWDKESVRLPSIELRFWGPLPFAKVDPKGPSFEQWVADIPGEMQAAGYGLDQYRYFTRRSYEVACNWKVYVDNYVESYHIPAVHPELYRELDFRNYRVDTFRYHSSQYSPLKPTGRLAQSASQSGNAGKGALYYWLFPNFMLNLYPEQMHISAVYPLGVDKTLVVFDWYLPKDNPSLQSEEELTAFNDKVQKEDMEICERVQKGLTSGSYCAGRYSPKLENGLHHFHQLIQEFAALR